MQEQIALLKESGTGNIKMENNFKPTFLKMQNTFWLLRIMLHKKFEIPIDLTRIIKRNIVSIESQK